MKTGNVTLINGAMVREVITDPATGLATGVSYVDTQTLQEVTVKAKSVVLAASAGETARLLLNSKSSRFQTGLANSSNVVGKYINDSTGASRSAFIPALMDRKRYNEDGVGGMHVFTPWWLDKQKIGFPARLPHRILGRHGYARLRIRLGNRSDERHDCRPRRQ